MNLFSFTTFIEIQDIAVIKFYNIRYFRIILAKTATRIVFST